MLHAWAVVLLVSTAMLILVTGCGGSGDDGTTSGGSADEGLVIAALGDSITAGNPNFDPDPEARAQYRFSDNPRSQYEYWAERNGLDLHVRNCGVFGERTDEIAKRFDACAKRSDGVIVQGGINDIAQSLQAPPAERIRAVDRAAENLRGIVEHADNLGYRVALTDVLPWNNGFPLAAPLIDRLNAKIQQIGEATGVRVLPFYATLNDSANPGNMKPKWTADGDHPSIEGYRRLGEDAFMLPGCATGISGGGDGPC